ncbi:Zinc finger, CCHC domain containing [Seminavis robusta]|uniref:Zinc finger, CCHC domain containing n=1 Tax=Seminavis robusta TaxID=568900 RepID=A0A9N8DUE5_9STRA|nr:Zinc finger, CCHC domain containing [Seminavis robusta]|eukprot:Sro256_g100560.1 Zinc finger, CCHC domain containing (224) ;mRNA; f:13944-14615
MTGTTTTTTPPSASNKMTKHNKKRGPKPKMTKEERRAKYTQLARDRETRRRKKLQHANVICYNCRERGHAVADCPNNTGERKKTQSTICFKCGSTEHSLSQCPKRQNSNSSDLPFCHCFICHQTGHLSSKCPQNEKGIFVNGGACKKCGSKQHTSKQCPENQDNNNKKKEKSVTGLPEINPQSLMEGKGDDLAGISEEPTTTTDTTDKPEKKQQKKKRRVVKF